jgi:hypothetical protein
VSIFLSQPQLTATVLVALIAAFAALAGAIITARSAQKIQQAKNANDQQVTFYQELGDQVTQMTVRVDALMKGMATAQMDILTCLRERNELSMELRQTKWELNKLAERGDEVHALLRRRIAELESKIGEASTTPITGQISGTVTVAPAAADSAKE